MNLTYERKVIKSRLVGSNLCSAMWIIQFKLALGLENSGILFFSGVVQTLYLLFSTWSPTASV